MPININQGNSAKFVVQFLNPAGAQVNPSSAAVTIVYKIAGVTNSATIGLSASGSFWTATWSSAGADLGLVDWSVASNVTTNPAQIGQLRIIDP